jgi:hypothetical protein
MRQWRNLAARGLGLAALLVGSLAHAQGDGKMPSQSFEALKDGVVRENLPGWPFLYGAYGFILFCLLAYIIFLWSRQRTLDAKIAQVDRRLTEVDQALDKLSGQGG